MNWIGIGLNPGGVRKTESSPCENIKVLLEEFSERKSGRRVSLYLDTACSVAKSGA